MNMENGAFFLAPEYILDTARYLKLGEEIVGPILSAAEIMRSSSELQRLALHYHYLLFEADGCPQPVTFTWPRHADTDHGLEGLFHAVIFLSGIKKVRCFYETNAIPTGVITDTYSDLGIWMRDYKNKHGVWGLDNLGWLMKHISGKLYKLGRLQFIPGEFEGRIKVFRSNKSGKLSILSEAGITFRADGQINGTNGIFDEKGCWRSSYEEDGRIFRGNPIMPSGTASEHITELNMGDWVPVLSKGDTVLDVHIPAGEKMDHGACIASYHKAVSFFGKYFPEVHFKGFACESWLLDSQLKSLLAPASNIVEFQSDYCLYPLLADGSQAMERVFGGEINDLSKAPRKTSLQAIILDHLISGRHMRSGAGFILASMLPVSEGVVRFTQEQNLAFDMLDKSCN